MQRKTKTTLKLTTLVLSAALMQSCGPIDTLNEAAGKFNRSVLKPLHAKLDDACGIRGIVCSNERYKELGYFNIRDTDFDDYIWHKPKSADEFFAMCESDRYGCGKQHYEFHPNWEFRDGIYYSLSYGKKHLKQMKDFARHEDSYNEVIKVGTQICKVNQGHQDEVGYTERFIEDSGKIQIRLKSNGFLIWDDAINWYTCSK
ncbi:hypothetical protein [uncultured Gammaproteobacteria bacterium]|uniref:hypothetical protein n=1 Tax=Bathymodiolus heckerae thiotrophic gill symbiont TaxID=1052212 RepID=UPI0010AFA5DC|nr:hypothetical protein [Bathymodiolus heckerae thiotrophic gill symbiont]CAC9527427.1 hypothetical protein [uncultured Gammaproteobacteria bacterium]CAC9588220.1 hypothetical protein [uncultured Gammaproteobacteria bacterium]CAC9959161.1 hypothetical protein [uncultured Gammaproteobacteria bacterium]SHN89530.1 hypothetical protein BHECKSOX_2004 [Bathymodiolus heckerae thiotrophic gill symbiont]